MPTRRQRLARVRAYGGYRSAHFARSTRTLVVVCSAEGQGLDPGPNGETKWYTICDDHDGVVGHETLKLALWHASQPEGWCEVCMGSQPPLEDD